MVTSPEPITGRPLTLLYLVAAPLVTVTAERRITPVVALDSQAELDAIGDACTLRASPIAVTIQPLVATTELVGHVLATQRTPLDILHFTGHGTAPTDGSALIFEDGDGAARRVDHATFQALLAPLGHAPCQLAFLSACHSEGMASVLLDAGVRHVVVVNADDAVLDHAARQFAKRLYPSLLAGHTVAQAFEFACTAVLADDTLTGLFDHYTFQPINLREAAKFQLLPVNDPIHDQPLIWPATAGTVTLDTARWERTNLDQARHDPFIGRMAERYELGLALRNQRCVHLDGYGGMGKTALAGVVGRWLHERSRWMDGVWMVELRHVTTVAQARIAIALALNLEPSTGESNASLVAALGHQDRLLILDDLDALLTHDRTATAALLNTLLTTRRIQLLTTSRRTLPGGVHHYRIAITRLISHDALMAFREYAGDPTQWGPLTGGDVTQLMKFLDGYPFPIRLAAAYMLQTRCGLRRLLERLTMNPQGTYRYPHDDEDRTTSLAATLDLSYTAITPDQQQLFARLSLFPGGILRTTIPLVFGESAEAQVETLLAHSLVEYRTLDGDDRFILPEPARRYAEARLPADTMITHAPVVLDILQNIVERGDGLIRSGCEREGTFLITLEMPNIHRFLDWAKVHEEYKTGLSLAAQIVARLGNYWVLTNSYHTDEPLMLIQYGLASALRLSDRLGEAHLLRLKGDMYRITYFDTMAMDNYKGALELYQNIGDHLGEANVLHGIGEIQKTLSLYRDAMQTYRRCLELYKLIGDQLGVANTLHSLGELYRISHDYDTALEYFQESLNVNRGLVNNLGIATALRSIGDSYSAKTNFDNAMESYTEALSLYQEIGEYLGEAATTRSIGDIYTERQLYDEALDYYKLALSISHRINDRLGEANAYHAIGRVQYLQGFFDISMKTNMEALKLYQMIKDFHGEIDTYISIGEVYEARGDYTNAMDSYRKSLNFFQSVENNYSSGKAKTLSAMARCQPHQDIFQSNDWFNQAIACRKEINDWMGIIIDHNNYGEVLAIYNFPLSAIDNLQQARSLAIEHGFNGIVAQIEHSITRIESILSPAGMALLDLSLPITIRIAIESNNSVELDAALAALPQDQQSGLVIQLQASGIVRQAPSVEDVLNQIPEAVRDAIERRDSWALEAALTALPPNEVSPVVAKLQDAKILGQAVILPIPSIKTHPDRWSVFLEAVVAITHGDMTHRPAVEEELRQADAQGWMLYQAVALLWDGERDQSVLMSGLDDESQAVIHAILLLIAEDPSS